VQRNLSVRSARGEVVLVSRDANLVYIPGKCIKKESGDKTRMGPGSPPENVSVLP